MAVYMITPDEMESPIYTTTYVDTLDSENLETMAYAELVSFEPADAPDTWTALLKTGGTIRARIKAAFDEAGIEIPFPQRTVWIRNERSETS